MSSQTPPNPQIPLPEDRFLADCLLYLDGQLSAEGFASLQQTMRREPERLEQFVDLAMHREMVSDVLDADHADEQIEQALDAYGDVSTLGELPPIHIDSSRPLTRKAYTSALSYIIEHTFTPKRTAIMATAAGLLIGAVLAIVFLTGGPDDEQPTAKAPEPIGQPVQPDSTDVVVDVNPVVATLTAEHKAAWDHRPGQDLYAGQRFTLTQGRAEVTTARGAIALIQAPATIELTDSPNAIRLHRGRLVGICDTESSKGFVVHTPQLNVIDLGTRFGVDASDPQRTDVHVFQGEVEVEIPGTESRPKPVQQRLIAGQAVSAQNEQDQLNPISEDLSRFAVLSSTEIPLPGTGFGLEDGETDYRWQISKVDGNVLEEPLSPVVYWLDAYGNLNSKPNDPLTSQWIGLLPSEVADKKQTYVFETSFSLPEQASMSATRLDIDVATIDHAFVSIHVNGRPVPVHPIDLEEGYTLQRLVIDRHLQAGKNVIEFEVSNRVIAKRPDQIVLLGLRLEWRALLVTAQSNPTDRFDP